MLKRAREALRLVPNDSGWLAIQQQAQSKLAKPTDMPISLPTAPRKTKEQWVDEAKAFIDSKQFEEALVAAEQAIRLDPNYAFAYNKKSLALYYLKRYEESLAAYAQALRLDPNFALAYYGKSLALEQLGKNREAQQAFEKARNLGYTP